MLQNMNIIVCVKQTPEAGRGEMNPGTGTVCRTGQKQVINPFDLYAMEAALRVQEKEPDTRIIAVSMGPASAASVLRDCIGLGAETGYLVSDPAFEGSDVRGTAQVLARAVRVIEKREGIRADAVFCGAKTVDGGTSMLGPELAQFLGVPQVTYALHCSPQKTQELQKTQEMQEAQKLQESQKLQGGAGLQNMPEEAGARGIFFRVEKEDDRGNRIYCLPAPCLVTFTKASFQVRYPLIARILEAESMELPVLTAEEILAEELPGAGLCGDNSAAAGPGAAAMQVQAVQLRKLEKQSQIIEDPDPVKAVAALAQRLFSEGIL
jgi:electron transfer flavoprotein beta subunit